MVDFLTKNQNLGKFWRVLQRRVLVHFSAIWLIFPVLVCCAKKNVATLLRTQICSGLATFWAIFSQTCLATLLLTQQ
jgi:hypothetical protein